VKPRICLVLLLWWSAAEAREPFARSSIRTVLVTKHPADVATEVYVSGQIATVLRFEYNCVRAKTKLFGGEGRFKPLVIGRNILVVEPLHDLREEESVPLSVAMADGTRIAILLKAPGPEDWKQLDHQVSFFKNEKSYEAVVSALYDSLARERELKREIEELRKVESSPDHALATLLLEGELKKTTFRSRELSTRKQGDIDVAIEVYGGSGKAAVTITLANETSHALSTLEHIRVSQNATETTARPFAYRVSEDRIGPGETSTIAAVVDKSAFESEGGLVDLALEIFAEDWGAPLMVKLDHKLVLE